MKHQTESILIIDTKRYFEHSNDSIKTEQQTDIKWITMTYTN